MDKVEALLKLKEAVEDVSFLYIISVLHQNDSYIAEGQMHRLLKALKDCRSSLHEDL